MTMMAMAAALISNARQISGTLCVMYVQERQSERQRQTQTERQREEQK